MIHRVSGHVEHDMSRPLAPLGESRHVESDMPRPLEGRCWDDLHQGESGQVEHDMSRPLAPPWRVEGAIEGSGAPGGTIPRDHMLS